MRQRVVRVAGALVLTVGIAASCTPPPSHTSEGRFVVAANFTEGIIRALFDPNGPPLGANDWNCKPSGAHPNPVVLVHGTFANMADSWQAVSPTLANEGYCVFALNFGSDEPWSFLKGTRSMQASAMDEFGPFVDRVLAATGARRVDVIGHSQGNVMPRYWMRNGDSVWPDGTAKTGTFIGIAPAGGGTEFYGLTALARFLGGPDISIGTCRSCIEFLPTSPFLASLADPAAHPGQQFAGETQPGVNYVMLGTKYDNVVMPYRNGFLKDAAATNITIQDVCNLDQADHLSIVYDPVTIGLVLNALDPQRAQTPACVWVKPAFNINVAAN